MLGLIKLPRTITNWERKKKPSGTKGSFLLDLDKKLQDADIEVIISFEKGTNQTRFIDVGIKQIATDCDIICLRRRRPKPSV